MCKTNAIEETDSFAPCMDNTLNVKLRVLTDTVEEASKLERNFDNKAKFVEPFACNGVGGVILLKVVATNDNRAYHAVSV